MGAPPLRGADECNIYVPAMLYRYAHSDSVSRRAGRCPLTIAIEELCMVKGIFLLQYCTNQGCTTEWLDTGKRRAVATRFQDKPLAECRLTDRWTNVYIWTSLSKCASSHQCGPVWIYASGTKLAFNLIRGLGSA